MTKREDLIKKYKIENHIRESYKLTIGENYLVDKLLKAINDAHCCKSDSEQLVCDCPVCGKEMTSQMVKHHHCEKCKEHYTTT